MARYRTGCIYKELQRNLGKGRDTGAHSTSRMLVRGVGYVTTSRYRWVCEFYYHNKRHRFRSTNFCNVVKQMMHWREVFNDDCDFLTQKTKENYE